MQGKYARKKELIASVQYQPSPADLQMLLALTRFGTLAAAGERLGVDASTVFRSLQRIERGTGRRLFDRGRGGYVATELARSLAEQAERLESALEGARAVLASGHEHVAGTVRITTTDTVLPGLVAPALQALSRQHPLLAYELHTGNELASITRRDADIAVRATKRPPPHLVGKPVGAVKVALYAGRKSGIRNLDDVMQGRCDWIAPDDALPDHPSVLWRKRQLPKVQPRYRVNSILSVLELTALGMGVGIVPLFLAEARKDLVRLSEPIEDCETDLWLLTHPEMRHLRRVSAVYAHLAATLSLS
ncbi:MAG: LysR family transcriptional regulator [Pseudomonadota bacterium]